MFSVKCVTLVCLMGVLGANAGTAVSFIDRCYYTDSKCILESANKAMPHFLNGISELGIPPYHPMILKDVCGDNGDLKLFFDHLEITTLPLCKITKVERPTKEKLDLEFICPITMDGGYKMDGSVGPFAVQGDGDFQIKSDKFKFIASILLKQIEKDDEKYYKIKSFDFSYEALERVQFNPSNLFNGDKTRAEPVIAFINENWKEMVDVLGGRLIKEMLTHVIGKFDQFFSKVPCSQLELDEEK